MGKHLEIMHVSEKVEWRDCNARFDYEHKLESHIRYQHDKLGNEIKCYNFR